MTVPAPSIIVCSEWGARKPHAKPRIVGRPDKCLVHHTDGHHPEISMPTVESREEAVAYARAIQRLHMDDRGWNDSGHNFLVARNGLILQGRWGTVSAIQHGRMVESAHCPGQNGNPGVEFEHLPGESLSIAQYNSGTWLYAWIMDRCGIPPTALFGHHDFYATQCPDTLYPLIKKWRGTIAAFINFHGRGSVSRGGAWRAPRAVRREIRSKK